MKKKIVYLIRKLIRTCRDNFQTCLYKYKFANLTHTSETHSSFPNLSVALILVFLFTFSCSDPFPKGALFDFMILQKLLTNSSISGGTSTSTSNKYIFLTVGTYTGNLGGVTGADAKCQTEKTSNFASVPGAATEYKAFIVDGVTRMACSNPNCSGGISENVDWVLKPTTDYYRLDGTTDTKVFTTNASGIVNFTGGSTLLTAIDTSGSWWTGLDTDWVDFGLFCTITWGSTGGSSSVGIGNSTSVTAIKNTGSNFCNVSNKLLCVRQ